MNYFFTNNDIFLYLTCRKINNPIDDTVWSLKYAALQESYFNTIRRAIKPALKHTVYFDPEMLDIMETINDIDDQYWQITKLSVTSEEANNGNGSINLRSILDNFIIQTGGGHYIIQYFFGDSSENPVYSLPSNPILIKLNIIE